MEFIQGFFGFIGTATWGWTLIPLLVAFGIFFTLATGFVQFEFFLRMFNVLRGKNQTKDPNAISGREALWVSLAGRVGGGNIAGVAVAITLGGPGAVFWMWMTALIGMATSLVECTLAQVFKRRTSEGFFRGGPERSIIHGLGKEYRWFAGIFSVCMIAAFALGFPAFQGNTVAGAALDSMGIERIWTASFLTIMAGIVGFGGIRRIAKAADVVVPVMALVYIGMAILVIIMNISEIPGVISTIVQNAFGFKEAVGGGMGVAVAQGMRRGLFSNEAGLGSAPNVAATATVRHPVTQGITQSLSVFLDTVVICSCTAFVILLSDVYVPGAQGIDGIVLTQQSLVSHLGGWTQYFLTFAILLFSFSSVIYSFYMGENAMSNLTSNRLAIPTLRIAILCVIFTGGVAPGATAVFFFSDPLMGVLAIVNLLALMMLFPVATRVLADYRSQLKKGIEHPVFDPSNFQDLDIDLTAWDAGSSASKESLVKGSKVDKAAA